ncbi:MAG TPA: hypothetical protein VM597_07020 [Gemmataceae bacterium]|jgi:hypothetical protein|nr:hypothetical protein [Gemmataceae bacterium]
MRPLAAFVLAVACAGSATAQEFLKVVPPRFDVLYNPDLYPQRTPKEALAAALGAIERGRFDYLAAHVMAPGYVDARLRLTQEYFERVAAEQIATSGQRLDGRALQERIFDVGTRLNVRNLVEEMARKAGEDQEALAGMRRFLREGVFEETGDTAVGRLKDVKDRAVYFKLIDGRWFLDNRTEDRAAKE